MKTLPSKMKCYIIPKKGYVEKQAIVSVNYGSVDSTFILDGKRIETPDGIAHFLEHKLFEDKKKNIFDEFTKIGGSVNAFTNFTNTAYYFNCNENFRENLRLLLDFTADPYFTEENVEKEKGIINQEIEMYDDNPFWTIYLNLQEAMYKHSPVKKNIAGSVESIQKVNKDLLYQCYDAFYTPENMVLVCVGDFEPEEVFQEAGKWSKAKKTPPIKRMYGNETKEVSKNYVEQKMPLARPMFNMGFKDDDFTGNMAHKAITTKIVMDMIAGESSQFFEQLYDKGLIDGPFALDYTCASFFGTAVFSNSSDKPREICELIDKEIERIKQNGLDENRFEQIKRKHMGRYIRSFNSIDNIATGQADLYFKGMDLFDIMDGYKDIDIEMVKKRLHNFFRDDNYVVSVVKPM